MHKAFSLGMVALVGVLLSFEVHAQSVLILGDSLSVVKDVGLGNRLDLRLRALGHQVRTVASCGSAPSNYRDPEFQGHAYKTHCGYLRREPDGSQSYRNYPHFPQMTPRLDELTSGPVPELAVIQQGTNLYRWILADPLGGQAKMADEVRVFLKNLWHHAPQCRCLWVGPAQLSQFYGESGSTMLPVTQEHMQAMNAGILQGIAAAASELGRDCGFVDSLPVTSIPGGDGIHHTKRSQTENWVKEVLSHLPGLG